MKRRVNNKSELNNTHYNTAPASMRNSSPLASQKSSLSLSLSLSSLVYIVVGSLVTTTLFSFSILSSNIVRAVDDDTSVDNVNITVQASCTMSGTGMNSHNSEIVNGTYREGIGTTTLKAFCNDNGGFAIYAIGYTGDSYTGTNHTRLVGTNDPTNTIITGTATSSSTSTSMHGSDTSNWAMKLQIVSDSGDITTNPVTLDNGYGSYSNVPDTYTKVAHKDDATSMDTTTGGVTLSSTYAAYISSTQPADTYSGKVKYTLVHPSTETPLHPETTQAGKICYYPNGSNVVGSMGCQTVSTSATNATLLASNFSREGYGFAGWSTTFDYSDSTGFYGPQEYITFDAGTYTGSNPGLSLYAHWVKSAGSLQSWTGCSSLASGAVTALTDQRDGDTYAVAKLADGNCWMIENLRLDNTNSDNSTGALSQGYATGFVGLAGPEAPWSSSTTTANSLYSTDDSTSVTISGSNPAYRMPRYNNVNTPSSASDRPSSPTSNSATNSTSNAGMYSYGNYYTWTAASTDTSTTSAGDYNTKSICPTGWSIPRGGNKSRESTNDFWTYIVTNLNDGTNPANYDSSTQPYYDGTAEAGPVADALRSYPNNFVYSGYINSSTVYSRGSNAYYWSSTASGSNLAYYLYMIRNYVYPGTDYSSKSDGRSVRCILPSTQ